MGSAISTATEADTDRSVRKLLGNPYSLDPDPAAPRPSAPDESSIGWNKQLGMFTIPFVMAQVNTRVVRRAHALAGFPWGEDFRYREVMSTPGSARGAAMAVGITAGLGGMGGAQPLAVTMNGGVALCIDVDPWRVQRRIETRYLDEIADSLDEMATALAGVTASLQGLVLGGGLELCNGVDVVLGY